MTGGVPKAVEAAGAHPQPTAFSDHDVMVISSRPERAPPVVRRSVPALPLHVRDARHRDLGLTAAPIGRPATASRGAGRRGI